MLAMKFPLPVLAGCIATLLCGCPKREAAPPPATDASGAARAASSAGQPEAAPASASASASTEACVDAWLKAHGRDRYGNAEGTMYAGGTPLFDERTGLTTDRLDYVFARQPEARAACAPDSGT